MGFKMCQHTKPEKDLYSVAGCLYALSSKDFDTVFTLIFVFFQQKNALFIMIGKLDNCSLFRKRRITGYKSKNILK